MSTSILTAVPRAYSPITVTDLRVRDDVDLELRAAPTALTVRLTPSTATEPFARNVAAKRRRNRDDDALRASDGLDGDDLADAVDVARHDVTVERIARSQRRLEIHARARGQAAERRDGQRRSRHVGGEARRGATATAVRQTPLTATLPPTASGATRALPSSMTKRRVAPVVRARRDPPDAFHQSENTCVSPSRAQALATLLTRAVIRKSAPILADVVERDAGQRRPTIRAPARRTSRAPRRRARSAPYR